MTINPKSIFILFLIIVTASALPAPHVKSVEPPEGTRITNVASAEYVFEGRTYVTNSNQVVTEIKPVYGLSILPNGNEESPAMVNLLPPGGNDCFTYVLKNTGNTVDRYDLSGIQVSGDFSMEDLRIVRDVNGNGVKDPGEKVITVTSELQPKEEISLLLCFETPSTAEVGSSAFLNILGTSRGNDERKDADNVNKVEITGAASLKLKKSPAEAEIKPGKSTTWTITGENTGSVAAEGTDVEVDGTTRQGILLIDQLTGYAEGTRFVSGSIDFSRQGYPLYSTDGGDTWTEAQPPAEEIDALGYLITSAITPGERFEFSYSLEVAGEPGLTTNVCRATYDNGRDNVETAEARGTLRILPEPNLVIGPRNYPSGNSPGERYTEPSGAEINTEGDRSFVKKVNPGSALVYENTLANNGNSTRVLNVSLDPSSTLPGGWNVTFLNLAGGPLSDSNGDGLVDIGPVSPGERVTVRVKIEVPFDPGERPEDGWRAVIRTSLGSDPDVYDLTVDEIATEAVESIWELKKEVSSGTARYGDELTYTLEFKNISDYPVKDVYFKDKLDPGLQPPTSVESGVVSNLDGPGSIRVEGDYRNEDHLISWKVTSGNVPAGFKGELTFTAGVVESEDDLAVTKPVPMVRNHFSVTGCYVLEPNRCKRTAAVSTRVHTVIAGESILELEKFVNRDRVKPGEVVAYTIRARNPHPDITLENVEIRDTLPGGFTYVDGSTVLEGSARPDPDVAAERQELEWKIGSLSPGEEKEISFDARLDGSLSPDTYVNVAYADGNYEIVDPNSGKTIEIPARAGPAQAAVLVVAGLIRENTSIVGRVFWDTNRDGYQDPGEEGIEGVRVVTQTGEYALTGEEGRYHLIDLRPGARIVVADSSTLPDDARLVTESRKLRLIRGGPVRRADFPVWREED